MGFWFLDSITQWPFFSFFHLYYALFKTYKKIYRIIQNIHDIHHPKKWNIVNAVKQQQQQNTLIYPSLSSSHENPNP